MDVADIGGGDQEETSIGWEIKRKNEANYRVHFVEERNLPSDKTTA